MRFGLVELFGKLRFFKGANYAEIQPPASIPASYTLTLPDALPGSTQALTIDASGNAGYASLGAGGTVTSVALSLPSIFNVTGSPVTVSGTLTAVLATQSANQFFAGPSSGAAAAPTFRALTAADMPGGTNGASWLIDADAANPILLLNDTGVLKLRNSGNTGWIDLELGNLTVRGTITAVESETVTIADNIILLNSNVTGTPTENAGIQIERGVSTDASLIWDETLDRWVAGLAGAEVAIARTYRTTFTNASLTAGLLTVTHNLNVDEPLVQVVNNSAKVIIPDDFTFSSPNALTVDLTSYGTITGTWSVRVVC